MGAFSASTGLATIFLIMMFKGIVRKFGWFTGAIITPTMLLITSILFFTFIFFKEDLSPMVALYGMTPLFVAVMIGAGQNILSKGTKYSLFDPTKEMSYIPLDQELKVKGKAAVDVIGSRLGKALGGYTIAAFLIITAASDLLVIAPYLAVIVIMIIFVWMISVNGLSKMYNNLIAAHAEAE